VCISTTPRVWLLTGSMQARVQIDSRRTWSPLSMSAHLRSVNPAAVADGELIATAGKPATTITTTIKVILSLLIWCSHWFSRLASFSGSTPWCDAM
jgi:hypothetical protein